MTRANQDNQSPQKQTQTQHTNTQAGSMAWHGMECIACKHADSLLTTSHQKVLLFYKYMQL